ncbi:BRCT domain-containing protein/PHD domain-containing protein/PTCB-BRCT domain-containing protein [Cephalotus follicularis]|uniref:BRCT domain-containing protein/PHD domain-containing protein/PTCB-BRCT domain-containing protein n=1 Tax=Cephalotus follicularis TaxID=3775 RepID=A0A1Q3CR32_CEPFO|nr:BRCT domain-containing protein/PHD domain-containing protein/PTCB-BRCT domain-containing protein [Cephalotus follicularis]
MDAHSPSKPFLGVRFVLFGFDPINQRNVRSKLFDGGGVDVGQYSDNCTHVVVDKIVYDDTVCVTARNDGKTLVTGLWVDHSFDTGMPIDATSIMYRPLKDLNGIPGAKSLVMCLTGYQRQDRDDIMTMVALMGAQFSKPLVANKVTHLICYKFEGEKFELAKKMKKIKLINHLWLEDCLRDWELHSEANYNKSGYELEMEAEAKDSEEEAEDSAVKQFGSKSMSISPRNLRAGMLSGSELPNSVGEVPKVSLCSTVPEDTSHVVSANILSTPGIQNQSHRVSSFDDVNVLEAYGCQRTNAYRDATSADLSSLHDRTPNSAKVDKLLASSSKSVNKSSESDTKFGSVSYSRKTLRKSTLPTFSRQLPSNVCGSVEANFGVEHADTKDRIGSGYDGTLRKGTELHLVEDISEILPQKRLTDISGAVPKSPIVSPNAKVSMLGSPSEINRIQGMEPTSLADGLLESDKHLSNDGHCFNETANLNATRNSPSSVSRIMSSSLNKKSFIHDLDFETSGPGQTGNAENSPQKSSGAYRESTVACKPDIGNMEMERSVLAVPGAVDRQNQSQNVEVSLPNNRNSEMENAHCPAYSDFLEGVNDKLIENPPSKKMAIKKSLGSRPKLDKSANKKGSIYPKKSPLKNDPAICLGRGKEVADHEKFTGANTVKISSHARSHEASKEVQRESITNFGDDIVNRIEFMDDETEPPDDIDKHVFDKAFNKEKSGVVELTHEVEKMTKKKSGVWHNEDNLKVNMNDDAVVAEEEINGTELDSAIHHKKFEVGELNLKGDGMKRKIIRGKRQSSDKAKTNNVPAVREVKKSKKIVNEEGTQNGKEGEMEKEKNVQHSAEKPKRSSLSANKWEVKKSKKSANEEGTQNGKEEEMEKDNKNLQHPAGKTKSSTLSANKLEKSQGDKENQPFVGKDQNLNFGSHHVGKSIVRASKAIKKSNPNVTPEGEVVSKLKNEPVCFILSGHRLQRKEFQQVIRRLKGRFCRDSHQWSYQATHFIAPDPIRRTEKFFAAAASGRWILKTDYLSACSQAGKFLAEEPYEWHKNGLNEDGAINLEGPRKWRILRERTGHGALYGMRVIVYGECIAPPLDTLKRTVKAGDGTILATSPPYSRFLKSGVDYAIVSPGMPHVDLWVQEFLKHEIPCVVADYLVEYVCKPGYSLERHVLYSTHAWAEKSFANLQRRAEEIVENMTPPDVCDSSDIACQVCGSRDRGEFMLICGNESGSVGCGIGTHIDCCDPPLEDVPEEDWFCLKCSRSNNDKGRSGKKRKKGHSVLKSEPFPSC